MNYAERRRRYRQAPKLDQVLSIRVSTDEKAALQKAAEDQGLPLAEYIITRCLDDVPDVPAATPARKAAIRQGGRKGKRTDTVRLECKERYLAALSNGDTIKGAARAAGVTTKSVQGWRKVDEDFAAKERAIRHGQ